MILLHRLSRNLQEVKVYQEAIMISASQASWVWPLTLANTKPNLRALVHNQERACTLDGQFHLNATASVQRREVPYRNGTHRR